MADYHARKHSIRRTAADVLVGPGSKELMFLIQLVYYGDLCIPTPSWVSYEPSAREGKDLHGILAPLRTPPPLEITGQDVRTTQSAEGLVPEMVPRRENSSRCTLLTPGSTDGASVPDTRCGVLAVRASYCAAHALKSQLRLPQPQLVS